MTILYKKITLVSTLLLAFIITGCLSEQDPPELAFADFVFQFQEDGETYEVQENRRIWASAFSGNQEMLRGLADPNPEDGVYEARLEYTDEITIDRFVFTLEVRDDMDDIYVDQVVEEVANLKLRFEEPFNKQEFLINFSSK